jgi:hypothetical protein
MSVKIPLLIVVFMIFSATALAENEAALDLLQGYEWQLSEARLSELGADTYRDFLDIARDETQPNFIRARAVTVLTWFPNDEVWSYFQSGLVDHHGLVDDQRVVNRRQLVEGLCSSFLASRPEEVGDILLPMLNEKDVHLRTKAAKCLQQVNMPRTLNALTAYRRSISEPWELNAAGFSSEKIDQ